MLDHISLGVTDLERSRRFYDAALQPLGLVRTVDFQGRGSDYGAMAGQYGVEFTITIETGVSSPRGMHLCFRAPNRASVRDFHSAALAAGGQDDGGPGVRPQYHPDYYAAFVLDPDGHRIEAVCHTPEKAMIVWWHERTETLTEVRRNSALDRAIEQLPTVRPRWHGPVVALVPALV